MKCNSCGSDRAVFGAITLEVVAPVLKGGGIDLAGRAVKQADVEAAWKEAQTGIDENGDAYVVAFCTNDECAAKRGGGLELRYYKGPTRKGQALYNADGTPVIGGVVAGEALTANAGDMAEEVPEEEEEVVVTSPTPPTKKGAPPVVAKPLAIVPAKPPLVAKVPPTPPGKVPPKPPVKTPPTPPTAGVKRPPPPPAKR